MITLAELKIKREINYRMIAAMVKIYKAGLTPSDNSFIDSNGKLFAFSEEKEAHGNPKMIIEE